MLLAGASRCDDSFFDLHVASPSMLSAHSMTRRKRSKAVSVLDEWLLWSSLNLLRAHVKVRALGRRSGVKVTKALEFLGVGSSVLVNAALMGKDLLGISEPVPLPPRR